MTITLIAAMSENRVLAAGGRIPWHLPADIAHFRKYCEGKWLLAGRRTWEEMDGWFRPGQVPVVVTRRSGLTVPGGHAVGSVPEGVELARSAGAGECVVIGGGEVFAEALPLADRLILTEVQTTIAGEVFFPPVSPDDWRVIESLACPADAVHAFAFTIRRFERHLQP